MTHFSVIVMTYHDRFWRPRSHGWWANFLPLSVQPSSVFYYVKLIAFILYGMRLSFDHLIFVLSMLVIVSMVLINHKHW